MKRMLTMVKAIFYSYLVFEQSAGEKVIVYINNAKLLEEARSCVHVEKLYIN
jgi:hypothetical protein